ncbi:hypothetical protein PoB_003937900 [Plakobranchus ocellatus]|uniref:Uncharacterized protein n=1 Tax=Plakobranchus ocellatus TaxID=259542 RepID=A0AAV4AYM8_9GAST|nr:hypothetical protein PoB_003937900 [Plakobranchus ocellatus]
MDESSPQHFEEMDKKCTENNLVARHGTHSVVTATADDGLPNFKTPVHCKSSNVWTENVLDSGFYSAHPIHLSDKSSSASSSARLSPEQRKLSGGRRVTLGACHFSPVTRESFSVIRSRKLVFNESPDLFKHSTKHDHFDADVKSQERLSEDAEHKEEKRDYHGTDADTTLFSPISPGLYSLEKNLSNSSARLSPEDLETSLQDMSLEESASSSSSLYSFSHSRSISPSPLIKSSISQHEDSEAESAMSCSSSSEVEHEQKKQDAVETVCNVSFPLPTSVEHVTSSDSTVLPQSSCKEHFMTALHLTSAQGNNNNVISTSLACATNPPHCSQSEQHISQALHNQVADFNPGDILSLEKSITVTHHLLTCPQNDQADFQLVKSPFKRSGTNKTDIEYLFSPTKSRKTDNSQQLSPRKHATRNIFQDRRETAGHKALVKFDRLPEFVTFHSFNSSNLKTELTSSTNISTRGSNPTCVDSDKTIKDYPKLLISSHSLPSCFQKVMRNLSPAEPSRLIGRNIGVTTLDIIGSLYPHFSLCIARIMSNLDNEDLFQ